ncbi:hypothetical protein BWI97_08910 [Siphonobacter sp. BAB-5405]|nr:hypothetical protein BWI97_08910 [Siphonobacter sp. BAB-5405]
MQTRYLFKNTLPARMIRTLGIDFFVNLSKFRHFEQTSLILITLSPQFPGYLIFVQFIQTGKIRLLLPSFQKPKAGYRAGIA